MSSQLVISNGAYVDLDPKVQRGRPNSEGGTGFITNVYPNISVFYVISGLTSPDGAKARLHFLRMGTVGRRRGIDGVLPPSILDHTYPEYRRQQRLIAELNANTRTNTNNQPTRRTNIVNWRLINTRYLLSCSIHRNGGDVLKIMERMNNTNDEGWLRIAEQISTTTTPINTHLLEKEMVVKLTMCLKIICQRAVSKVGYAWGIHLQTIQR